MIEAVFRYDLTDAGTFGYASLAGNISGIGGSRYCLSDRGLISPYGQTLPSTIADLLDIAASIMWADRNSLRPRAYGNFMAQRGWVRQFELILGVRNPDLWNTSTVKETLVQLLTWLTEDIWVLQFQPQSQLRRYSDLQPSLFESPPTNALVVLYSGGLDSLAGTVTLLQEDPHQNVVLMSAVSDRLSGVVREQTQHLQRAFGADRVQHALMPFHVAHTDGGKEETTQRTRGFLFLSFGVAEAVACNTSRIITCENGIGLLNLPLNSHQLGAQNARAVHPKTLQLMNDLLFQMGFSPLQCGAPHLLKTKGELCSCIKASSVSNLCRATISCDSFPLRVKIPDGYANSQLHCGWCSSCLFRRQSLFAAALEVEDRNTPYQYNLCQPLRLNKGSRLERLKFLLDQRFLIQQACTSPLPELSLTKEFPELMPVSWAIEQTPKLFGLSSSKNVMEVLTQLFLRYVDEWERFPYVLHTL